MARTDLLIFEPDGFVPDTTSHPSRGIQQHRPLWWFDGTTVETLRTKQMQLPAAYAGGTLKADIGYIAAAASGKVDWEVSIEAITASDALDLDNAESFDTANGGNETVPGTAGYLGVLTITLTNADSAAAGDYVRFKLERDADDGTNDTLSGDAGLLFLTIYEES